MIRRYLERVDPVFAYKIQLLAIDVVVVTASFFASYKIRNLVLPDRHYEANPNHAIFLGVFLVLLFLYFRYKRLYRHIAFEGSARHFLRLTRSWAMMVLVFVSLAFFADADLFIQHRVSVGLFALLSLAGLTLGRCVLLPLANRAVGTSGVMTNNILIVGAEEADTAESDVSKHSWDRPIGYVDDDSSRKQVGTLPLLGSTESIEEVVSRYKVREVVIGVRKLDPVKLTSIIRQLRPLSVRARVALNSFGAVSERVPGIERDTGEFVVLDHRRDAGFEGWAKRAIDFVGAGLILLMLLPLLVLLGVLIKLDSRGPVFFKQRRAGKDGRPFEVFKFRTMMENTEDFHRMATEAFMKKDHSFFTKATGKKNFFKATDSSRVTRVGNILRRYSLDELPQLINVLRGEMSLIGPRPEPVYQVDLYKDWQHSRHAVRPGMTGFWQVFGRSAVSHEDMVLMDIFYIENWSLSLDLQILAKTPLVMLSARGAL